MAEIDDSAEIKPVITEATWGFLFLRLWIGFRMLFAGAEKFYAPVEDEATGVTAYKFAWGNAKVTAEENIHKIVAENAFMPLNPRDHLVKVWGVDAEKVSFLGGLQFDLWFAMALPYLLLVFGFLLVLGILPRTSLFMAGIIFMLLSIGLMALPDNEGIAALGVHVGLVAVALCLVKQARFNLTKY